MQLGFSRQIFEKFSNIKFHENPPSGSRFHAEGQTDRQRFTTNLIVFFCNLANAPKIGMDLAQEYMVWPAVPSFIFKAVNVQNAQKVVNILTNAKNRAYSLIN
jgi:hypothetical protein